ncbi:hypothetical protein [Noviherbaspirillum sp.]|uniref:hypothetical protein n=1 Tax=Noviherbaspirillum sp. TaxID=1926288 RepID=UPI002D337F4D|nr:hypothetical protein [Noviherbaspirillum sp.]HZW19951.1 hypothetical protein [Noviherbaspirillum sp.]
MGAYRTPGPQGKYLSPPGTASNGRPSQVPPPLSSAASPALQKAGSPPAFSALDPAVINSAYFTADARYWFEKGATPRGILLMEAGTTIYRMGSSSYAAPDNSGNKSLEQKANDREMQWIETNCSSPWWMRRAELDRILAKGQQDTAWAGRVMAAIAEVWGSLCDLQIRAATTCDLYVWIGEPKSIDVKGNAVRDDDHAAYWIPEKDLMQLYIPGLYGTQLWRHVFQDISATPWLWPGVQANLATGKKYSPASDKKTSLPAGKR